MSADSKTQLADLLRAALLSVAPEQADTPINLERPKQAGHGDFASNLALQLAKPLKRNPRDLANLLLAELPASSLVAKAEVAGAGFINFTLASDAKTAVVQRVRGIATRLTAATGAFRSDAPGWRWEVNVISSNELNAWCMPGGKIAVYTGIIERLQLTDDELAAVMGHEIAHALREHGREKAGQSAGVGAAAAIGGALIGAYYGIDASIGRNVLGTAGDLAFMRPNSRGMEQEADRIGVELAARAGYDPAASISLWQKMARASSGSPPQWLSTHPSNATRIDDLRDYSERVRPDRKSVV